MSDLPVTIKNWPAPGLLSDASKALASLPSERGVALIAFAEGGKGGGTDAGVAVVAKFGKGWECVGRFDRPADGGWGASVTLVKSW